MEKKKFCSKCNETKNLSDFSKHKQTGDGHNSWCRKCVSIVDKAYRKSHPEKAPVLALRAKKWRQGHPQWQLRYNLRHHYKMLTGQYRQLLSEQHNRCKLCKVTFSETKRPCVDHNHTTGKIRGLLCSKCNRGLGCFNDNIETFEAAVEYLKGNNA